MGTMLEGNRHKVEWIEESVSIYLFNLVMEFRQNNCYQILVSGMITLFSPSAYLMKHG